MRMYSSSSRKQQQQPPQPASPPPPKDKYERFEQWLRDNGAKFELLELREYDAAKNAPREEEEVGEEKKEPTTTEESEMRGVHARTHIPPNTVCVTIPRRCLITVEMGQATPIGQAILDSDLDLDAPKHIFLMIYLLWDRKINGSSSFFHPYYEILPKTLRNMPIFWTPDELANLEGSYLLTQIADRNEAIAEDFHAICQIAPLAQICTLEEFKWARMETKWTFDEDRQAFTITTLQHIPGGAQVYDSYGQKCNHRFLLNYGFAVEDNREIDGFCPDEVPLELYVSPDDPLFPQKLDFWTRGEVGSSSSSTQHALHLPSPSSGGQPSSSIHSKNQQYHRSTSAPMSSSTTAPSNGSSAVAAANGSPVIKRIRICVSNNENTRLLFSLLRALVCNREELRAVTSPVSSDASVSRALFGITDPSRTVTASSGTTTTYYRTCRDIRHPINLRNERASMRLLLEVIGRQLSRYPTTLAQDVADLMDERALPRFSNKRHAKIQVRGEKEVLHHFARWARTSLDVLDVIEAELKEEAGVEVQMTSAGRTITEERPGFELVIRRMEEEDSGSLHHTILRYCADVLGSLRREEYKLRRRRVHSKPTFVSKSSGSSSGSFF
ncbi:SET domain containing [Seminavis robusta]|uniref:SET domain containing n=1 Tax=Seminavis robusta TaxID=568900 RepID=A0A9N8DH05_9STRA|nr:SET domain containing [Seminavis robusta]|eukprot:Sro63_g035710.1 SET domain containing (612) ;mRNA; r:39293-41499